MQPVHVTGRFNLPDLVRIGSTTRSTRNGILIRTGLSSVGEPSDIGSPSVSDFGLESTSIGRSGRSEVHGDAAFAL